MSGVKKVYVVCYTVFRTVQHTEEMETDSIMWWDDGQEERIRREGGVNQ